MCQNTEVPAFLEAKTAMHLSKTAYMFCICGTLSGCYHTFNSHCILLFGIPPTSRQNLLIVRLIILEINRQRLRQRQKVNILLLEQLEPRRRRRSALVDAKHLDAMARRRDVEIPVPCRPHKRRLGVVGIIPSPARQISSVSSWQRPRHSTYRTHSSNHPSASVGSSTSHVRHA